MTEFWNIAEECWSRNPWDRPSFLSILTKLDAFASLEEITPFELRKPKPMHIAGEPSRRFRDCSADASIHKCEKAKLQRNGRRHQPRTILGKRRRLPSHCPYYPTRPCPLYVTSYEPLVALTQRRQLQTMAAANPDGFVMNVRGKFKRAITVVRAVTRISRYRLR